MLVSDVRSFIKYLDSSINLRVPRMPECGEALVLMVCWE